jgi:uncharacterized protein (TIGR03066 family)
MYRSLCLGLLFAFALPAGAADKKPSDDEITKLLPGKWTHEEDEMGVKVKVVTTYKKDGTFAGTADIDAKGKTLTIKVSGTWKVKNGVIEEEIQKSDSNFVPKGKTSKDTVLAISETSLKLKSEEGKEVTAKRAKE